MSCVHSHRRYPDSVSGSIEQQARPCRRTSSFATHLTSIFLSIIVAAWGASIFVHVSWRLGDWWITSSEGTMSIWQCKGVPQDPTPLSLNLGLWDMIVARVDGGFYNDLLVHSLGFRFPQIEAMTPFGVGSLVLPYWSIAVVVLLLRFALRKKVSVNKFHCQNCGYWLIWNASGICPECGTPMSDEQKLAIGKVATAQ